ncbi:hypothetical protein BC835DRAFT_1412973 [Cytidiella melzeri]|nr:hypothetical protein BC835DRAFT_1412973 [Cytidiella melzeri]
MPIPSFLRRLSSAANAGPSSPAFHELPPPSYEQAVQEYDNTDFLFGENKHDLEGGLKGREEAKAGSSSTKPQEKVTEEELRMLANYDTVIILDDSGSMLLHHGYAEEYGGSDTRETSRWASVRHVISEVAEMLCAYDKDGIDLEFLNQESASRAHVKSRQEVLDAFNCVSPDPKGGTNIGSRLDGLLLAYRRNLINPHIDHSNVKKVNYIIITDGEATDDPEDVIVAHARWLQEHHYPLDQVGIQFFQIGNDPRATAYLTSLDDHLKPQNGAQRDIVDTTRYEGQPLTAQRLVKICVGGINRKYDRVQLARHE